MNWKTIAAALGMGAAALSIFATWVSLGFPIPATKQYVDSQVHILFSRQLKIWRQAVGADLATWRIANPTPDQNAQDNIKRLEKQADELDKRIEAMDQ